MYILKKKKITFMLVIAFIFSILAPLFNIININTIKAGSTMLIAREADSAYNYNPNASGLPASFKQHTAATSIYWANSQGGQAVYCIEIDNHNINGGGNYNTSSNPPISLNSQQARYLSVAIALGHTSGNNQAHQTATQAVVWMIVENAYKDSDTRNAILNGFIKNDSASSYAKQLWSDIVEFYEIPSFASDTKSGAKTYNMKWNNDTKKYEVTLKDSSGVTNNFDYSASGLSFSKSASSLKITAPSSYVMKNGGITIQSSTKTTHSNEVARLIYMTSGSYQSMVTHEVTVSDPVRNYFNLDIADGKLVIDKEAEDGVVSRKFNVKGTADNGTSINKTVTTNSKGTVTSEFPKGTYTVTETNIEDRYLKNEDNAPRNVKVLDAGRSVKTEFVNNLKYRFYLEKESEDGFVEGLQFRIQGIDETTGNTDYDRTVSLDENGKFKLTDLTKPGKYKVSEVNTPDRYIQPKEQIVELIDMGEKPFEITVKFYNELKHHLELEKISEDGVIEGLKFEVKGIDEEKGNTDFIQVVKTDDVGKWHLELEKAGKYQITELTPDRYQNPKKVIVDLPERGGEENTTYVTFENKIKKGNIIIEKWSDYPKDDNGHLIDPSITDEPLANATFELYRINKTDEDIIISKKMNEDLKLNIKESDIKKGKDMLVTELITDKKGKAHFNNLWYGDYYLIETNAPDGFILNNTKCYFKIGKSENSQNNVGDKIEVITKTLRNKANIGLVYLKHDEDVNKYGISVKTGDNMELYDMVCLFVSSLISAVGLLYMYLNKNNEIGNEKGEKANE